MLISSSVGKVHVDWYNVLYLLCLNIKFGVRSFPSKTIFILVSKQEGDKYLHGPGTQGHLVSNEDCLSDEGSENFETLVQPILK